MCGLNVVLHCTCLNHCLVTTHQNTNQHKKLRTCIKVLFFMADTNFTLYTYFSVSSDPNFCITDDHSYAKHPRLELNQIDTVHEIECEDSDVHDSEVPSTSAGIVAYEKCCCVKLENRRLKHG